MKFTLSWLQDHLDTSADAQTIAAKLTAIGLELEELTPAPNPRHKFEPFLVAHVISAEQHPNADKLRVCKVDAGTGEIIDVVCGAPNAKTGMKAVFAPVGTTIPGITLDDGSNLVLTKGMIRGEASNGMLTSERELLISEEHDGIIELPSDAPVGTPYADYVDLLPEWKGVEDWVFEIGLTPNRGDAAGIRGIARDLAAAGLGTLKPNRPGFEGGSWKSDFKVSLKTDDCPVFAYRVIRGIKNGPSPQWVQDRLTAIGQRPISALVDVTNLVNFDQCRPTHVFDLNRIKGDQLTVRKAQEGETCEALNEQTYALADHMTVIADANGPTSIAGIMGGLGSSVEDGTTDVVLEAALWVPGDIARTGRVLGIHSDARYRFERGTDPAALLNDLDIATQFIVDFCGGEPSEVMVEGQVPTPEVSFDLPLGLVEKRSGLAVPADQQQQILIDLGFEVSGTDPLNIKVPTWRSDVERVEDLTEEVLRIVGFDAVPATSLPRDETLPARAVSDTQAKTSALRRALAEQGLNEAYLWSFTHSKVAQHFSELKQELYLANPISSELDVMRPSLLSNLLIATRGNQNRGFGDVRLFEVGLRFEGVEDGAQLLSAAGLRTGQFAEKSWTGEGAGKAGRGVDAFDAKADALAALEAFGAPTANLQTSTQNLPPYFHPGRSGTLGLGKNILAVFGELHPAQLEDLDVRGPAVAFELFLDRVPAAKKKGGHAKALYRPAALQQVERDFAFLVNADVEAEKLLRAMKGADKAHIVDVTLFDVYDGKGIPEGKRSLAATVYLQPKDQAFTDDDLEAMGQRIIAQAIKATGGELRA